MGYRDQLRLSWALTWRLLLSNAIILSIVATLAIAFGSLRGPASSAVFFVLYFAMECFMAWPFVLRRTMPPQVFSLDARIFALRYWPSVLFGVAADLSSALPVICLHLVGTKSSGILASGLLLVRLFIVLPALIGAIARRPAAT